MNKVLLSIVVGVICAGCRSYPDFTDDGRPIVNTSLKAMALNTSSPIVGRVYIHRGRTIKVHQVVDGGVLAMPVVSEWDFEWDGVDAYNKPMMIFVETDKEYVDGEYLRDGFFEYVGIHRYLSVNNAERTVRKFKEAKVSAN